MEWPLQRHPLSCSHGEICSHHRCPPAPHPHPRYHHSFIPCVAPHLSLKHTCVQGPRRRCRNSPLNVRNICKYSQEKRGGEEKVEQAWGRGSGGDVILPPPPHPIHERTTAVVWSRTKEGWRVGQKGETPGWRRRDGDAGVGWGEDEHQKMLQVAADGGRCEVAETTESVIT